MKNFVLIGAAGYIAPKHLRAIKDTGNRLLAALDKHDSVGILDSYFPEADFFTEFERFDRHCEKLRRSGTPVDYVTVCSPNYLHDAHCRFGLRIGADVICEKPVVLNPWNVETLMEMEKETGKKVFTLLQLRYHPVVIALKNKVEKAGTNKKHQVELKYISPRGRWYYHSWKGDTDKSGGIATNIGIHFFDLLLWIFGSVKKNEVQEEGMDGAAGTLELDKATVKWTLSTTMTEVGEQKPYRSLHIDGEEIDLNNGMDHLHTQAYLEILKGNGIRLQEALPVIQLVHDIRNGK